MPVKLFTIEDNNIKAMMNEPAIMALVPALQNAKAQIDSTKKGKKNCHRCRAEKEQIVAAALNDAKTAIKSLRGTELARFKQLVNAQQVRVITRNSKGTRVKYTI